MRMRSLRSPEPIRLRRVLASFAWAARACMSLMRAASTFIALSLLRCCDRSSWHSTTMPVGRWVRRTAESVLFTCWPPAPEARKVSMRRSAGLISTSPTSSASGITATVQAEVWMRPCASVAGTRCTRWPPDSNFSFENAASPAIRTITSRKPPRSDPDSLMISTCQRWRSA
ncbi:hypothetical protein D3C81_1369160 [compost metagenome]